MNKRSLAIGINGSMLDEQPSGVGVYSFNVINNLSALCSLENLLKITVFSPTAVNLNKDVRVVKLPGLLQSSRYGKVAAVSRFLWNTFFYHHRARKYDLLISPTTHGSFVLKNQVLTIHDLLSLRYDNINAHQRIYFKYLLKFLVARAKLIVTVSETTKKDIIHFFKCDEEKIKVIYNGYDNNRYTPGEKDQSIVKEYGFGRYLLAVGPTYPHKNFEVLFNAYKKLSEKSRRTYPLLIAGGKKAYVDQLKHYVKNISIDNHVHFIGYVPLSLMPSLYRNAHALVFPSLYEGFGIPLLEAMACGCPVISSHTSSMPEVCGNAALYFDPSSEKSLEACINKIITDDELRQQLIEKGLERVKQFSWEQTALSLKKLIETYLQPTNS